MDSNYEEIALTSIYHFSYIGIMPLKVTFTIGLLPLAPFIGIKKYLDATNFDSVAENAGNFVCYKFASKEICALAHKAYIISDIAVITHYAGNFISGAIMPIKLQEHALISIASQVFSCTAMSSLYLLYDYLNENTSEEILNVKNTADEEKSAIYDSYHLPYSIASELPPNIDEHKDI